MMSPAENWETYDILIIDNFGCADEKTFQYEELGEASKECCQGDGNSLVN